MLERVEFDLGRVSLFLFKGPYTHTAAGVWTVGALCEESSSRWVGACARLAEGGSRLDEITNEDVQRLKHQLQNRAPKNGYRPWRNIGDDGAGIR
jgi:hypothetical protein